MHMREGRTICKANERQKLLILPEPLWIRQTTECYVSKFFRQMALQSQEISPIMAMM